MAEKLTYEQPLEMSREEPEAESASNDPERISHALLAAFLYQAHSELCPAS